jgi:spermidine/putrescine transport system substrate-binding protein
MHPGSRPMRGMSRRDFLRRSAGAAVVLPSAAAILAACSKPGQSTRTSIEEELLANPARPDHPVTLPLYQDPITASTPIEKGATLQVYNWEDYLWPRLFREFEDAFSKYDVKVSLTTFNNIDEGVAKLSAGQVSADVFFPDPSELTKLVVSKLLQPLQHDLLPNLAANYWPEFQNPFYDQGWRYTVPYVIYTTGIAYRRDHVPDSKVQSLDNPYEILWDPEYKGRVTIYDDRRETLSMALMKNGIKDVNTGDPKLIDMAKNDVLALIDATDAKLTINGIYSRMAEDVFWVGSSWSGDVCSAAFYYLPKDVSPEVLGFWYPPDGGGVIGNDLMVVPTSSKNPRLAHEFINFMLDTKNSFANFTNWNGYQPPMTSIDPTALVPKVVPPSLKEAVVVPSFFDTGSFILGVKPSVDALYSAAWDEIKAGG